MHRCKNVYTCTQIYIYVHIYICKDFFNFNMAFPATLMSFTGPSFKLMHFRNVGGYFI